MRSPTALAALALLAALAPSGAARADLVRTIDGQTVEGEVKRSRAGVTVRGYKGKKHTFPASEVKFIEEGELSWEVAARMLREIPSDADDETFVARHLEVARYLADRKQYTPEMEELERKEYEKVLKKATDNEEARLGLGHVRWEQWWFDNEKKRDDFRKRASAELMEPLGFVKYRKTGTWERPADIEAMEAGKVKFRGQWMTEEEKMIAQGYVKDENGQWKLARDVENARKAAEIEKAVGEKPVTVTASDNFSLVSWFPVGESAQLKDLAERTYAWYRKQLGIPLGTGDEPGEVLFTEPVQVFLFVDDARKEKWLDAVGKTVLGFSDDLVEFHKNGNWHSLAPYPYMAIAGRKTEKNRERDPDEDYQGATSRLTAMVGRIVLDRVRGPGVTGVTPWLAEGTSMLTEIEFNETALCCYVSKTEYREQVVGKDGSKAKYFEFMKTQVRAGLDRPLRQVLTMELNKLDWADSVKAWSFLRFLMEKHLEDYRELMFRPLPPVDEITPAQIEAAIKGAQAKEADDSAAGKPKEKVDEGPVPETPVRISGAGAVEVTKGSKEERAARGAAAEEWLRLSLDKGIEELEKDWKDWILKHP